MKLREVTPEIEAAVSAAEAASKRKFLYMSIIANQGQKMYLGKDGRWVEKLSSGRRFNPAQARAFLAKPRKNKQGDRLYWTVC